MGKCIVCNGDHIARCFNPDHGFISALSFNDIGRLGCPVCGHDEMGRVFGEACEFCDEYGNLLTDRKHEAEALLNE